MRGIRHWSPKCLLALVVRKAFMGVMVHYSNRLHACYDEAQSNQLTTSKYLEERQDSGFAKELEACLLHHLATPQALGTEGANTHPSTSCLGEGGYRYGGVYSIADRAILVRTFLRRACCKQVIRTTALVLKSLRMWLAKASPECRPYSASEVGAWSQTKEAKPPG